MVTAAEHWLLSAARDPDKARADWERDGLAHVRCGGVFTAVQIPGFVVHSAAQTNEPGAVDAFLLGALKGGPVIASAGLTRYSVLVPPSAARTWQDPGTVCLPTGTDLGVPPLTVAGCRPGAWYWAVPPRSAGQLCSPGLTDRPARYGQSRWAKWRR